MNTKNEFVSGDFKRSSTPSGKNRRHRNDDEAADYFGPNGFMEIRGYPVKVDSNDLSKDEQIAEKLWKVSEKMTGVKFDFNKKSNTANG